VRVTLLVTAAQTPIHVDVPNEAVRGANNVDAHVGVENSVKLILDSIGVSSILEPNREELWHDTREILAGIHQMHSLLCLLKFIQALRETEPEGQDAEDYRKPVGIVAFALQVDFVPVHERFLIVVAVNVEQVLDRANHRSYHISQEEMSEPDFATG